MNIYTIILAGGKGKRLWPISRLETPKQILKINDNKSFVNNTISRFSEIINKENIYVLTTAENKEKLYLDLKDDINYIFEPKAKGTAACILLAALKLYKQKGDSILCVSPSDHYIKDNYKFAKTLKKAFKCAEDNDHVITIGVKPTFPSSGYGYISFEDSKRTGEAYVVTEFVEKPEVSKALQYIKEERYLWNTGIFVFKASVIIESFKRFLPKLYDKIYSSYEFLNTTYEEEYLGKVYDLVQEISIDYGIIERLDNILVVKSDMDWVDIGTLDSLSVLLGFDKDGNSIKGECINIDTNDCIIYNENKLVATIGMKDMVIINTSDVLLICPKNESQKVKEIVQILEDKNLKRHL